MADPDELREVLRQVASDFGADLRISEAELVNRWFVAGVFSALGYGTDQDDYRIEKTIPGVGRADVVLRALGQRARAVLEFKRPGTPLDEHVGQLADYARRILPHVAILTNGRELWVFAREARAQPELLQRAPARFDLANLTPREGRALFDQLRKVEVDLTNMGELAASLNEIAAEPIPVEAPTSPGGVAFLERLKLEPRSVFGRLVIALFDALPVLERTSQFTAGSFGFWQRAYARRLSENEIPRAWRDFLRNDMSESARLRFMFALESAYAFLARTMLAKAMQDARFPGVNGLDVFRRAAENRAVRGRLDLSEYVEVSGAVFDHAGRQAFKTLFATDIFDWWQDAKRHPELASLAELLAEAMLAVFGFDFGPLRGDVLGELYQEYFDRETRLALGEFYTPPEVVGFILDEVGYVGAATDRGRLLDPACGSGTFLVEALQRYLRAHAGVDAATMLSQLIGGLHIVGLDVNPFAVLLAQVNYAAQLLPRYAEALAAPDFAIHNLPVFRTDSLRFEKREAEEEQVVAPRRSGGGRRGRAPLEGAVGFRLTYEGDMAVIRDRLPVKGARGEFIEVRLPVPRADLALERQLIDNPEEYTLAIAALFDAVEDNDDERALAARLAAIRVERDRDLAAFMMPALEGIRATIRDLHDQYDDGRFLKTLRDLAIAMVVKNEISFDFVVGNPPYVRVQRLPEELKAYWVNRYDWAQGNFDIYIPFIERAARYWLNDGGALSFICSNRFLVANYAEKLREELLAYANPELIFDLRDTRVFSGALNYPAVFVFRKGAAAPESFPAARAFAEPREGALQLLDDAKARLAACGDLVAYDRSTCVDAFRVPMQELSPQGWYLMPPAERRVFDRVLAAATHRLEELTATGSGGFQGLATGADQVMVLRFQEDRGDRLLVRPREGEDAEIEKVALRPWLFGRDVERWYVDWDGWYVLFPYTRVDGSYQLAPSRAYSDRFNYSGRVPFVEEWPGYWEYVNRPTVKSALEGREDHRWSRPAERHQWYGAARPQNLDHFERQKLVLQVSSTTPDMASDVAGHVFAAGGTSGVYGVLLRDEFQLHQSMILAILNSRPVDYVLKHVSEVYSGSAYSYGDQFLKLLPIRVPSTGREQVVSNRLGDLTASLAGTKARLRTVQRKEREFPFAHNESLPATIHRYPLRRLGDGVPQARSIDSAGVTWQTQLDGRPVMSFGRSRLALPSNPHAEVVRQWLALQPRQSIPAEDLMSLHLPEREAGCQRLLDSLGNDRRQIRALEIELADAEAEVDQLVLTYYGLGRDRNAKRVIEDFLDRF